MDLSFFKELAESYGWHTAVAFGVIYVIWKHFLKDKLDENSTLKRELEIREKTIEELGKKYENSLEMKIRDERLLYERMIEILRNKTSGSE